MSSYTCEACGQPFQPTWRVPERTKVLFCSVRCRNRALAAARTRKAQEPIEQQYGMPIADVLRHLYNDQRMGIKQIAQALGKSDRTIWDWFDALGIERRSRSAAIANQWQDNTERRFAMGHRMRELSAEWIAKHGAGYSTRSPEVRKKLSLSKTGPNNPNYGLLGEKHPSWKGGKVTYRGKGWRSIRTQILRRDTYTCNCCKKHYERKDLDIHHVIPYRETQDNRPENLVTVCKWCHAKLENREVKIVNGAS